MNISCAICAELFKNSDANQINITHCGHVFHIACLSTWLARSTTCPECRHKTTRTQVIRVYYNVQSYSDTSGIDGNAGGDVAQLQSENDNLKFKLLEEVARTKAHEDNVKKIGAENDQNKTKLRQAKQLILTLEQKCEQLTILQRTHCDQIRALEHQLAEIGKLQQSLDEANKKLSAMEAVKQVLHGTQKETEALLSERRTPIELATMATALKRELNALEAKYKQMRHIKENETNQLRRCKEEKSELEEKCSILESKVFQWENQNKEKENEDVSLTEDSMEDERTHNRVNDRFGDLKRRKITIETKTKSPHTFTVASSLAGLSPLLNTAKPSTQSKPPTEMSIFNKPRLIESHSKKSIIRPTRFVPSNSKSRFGISPEKSVSVSASTDLTDRPIPVYRNSFSRLDGAAKRVSKPIPK